MTDKQENTNDNRNSKKPPKEKPDGSRVGSNNTSKGSGDKKTTK